MRNNILLLLVVCLFSSCTQDVSEEQTIDILESTSSVQPSTRTSPSVPEYETLPNPYKLSVMQEVCDSLGIDSELEPTHYYVRFLPQDSLETESLYNDYDLTLIPQPLDIVLEEGDRYIDTSLTDSTLCWLYTTVPVDFDFPSEITYEILDNCYIPEDDETLTTRAGDDVDIELIAFQHLGYDVDESTRAGDSRPNGRFQVKNDVSGASMPLKGVKVTCYSFNKSASAYTDQNGNYSINKKFRYNPRYIIEYQNSKGFSIWGKYGPIGRTSAFLGWHSNDGYSKTFSKSERPWRWCAINNAAYDYYNLCDNIGIPTPPPNLTIWCLVNIRASAAILLNRMTNTIYYQNNRDFFTDFLRNMGIMILDLDVIFRHCVPDIFIGTKSNNPNLNLKTYEEIYGVVGHELAHASHFMQVGNDFWVDYVSHIVTYGKIKGSAYGDGTEPNAGVCQVGEMWGYAMGWIFRMINFGESGTRINPELWIDALDLFWLYNDNILSIKNIFDCLTTDIRSHDQLGQKLLSRYPNKYNDIMNYYFNTYIEEEEEEEELTFDREYCGLDVAIDDFVEGNNVLIEWVTTSNNSYLTVNATNLIVIKTPFTISKGCSLSLNIINE